jgi:transposase
MEWPEAGAVVRRRRMRPKNVPDFTSGLPARLIAMMEACCRAHHLGRTLASQGHSVRLISPDVRPYVKVHKNDDRDAEAIAEAATRPTMRFVELNQGLNRARQR